MASESREKRTKAREHTRASAQAAETWQQTFDSITDMVSIQDQDFNLVQVNKAYENAVKMKQGELIGKKCYEVVHGASCPVLRCPHKQTLQTGRGVTEEVFEPRLGVYLQVSTSPILDKKGRVTGSVHIAKDITARKQADDRVNLLNQSLMRRTSELEAANKELEAFSYSVSHDLRAPLRAINGFGQALVEECADRLDERGRDYLQRIRKSTQLMSQLIDDLLRLSRATMAEMSYDTVDLTGIAGQIGEALSITQPGRQVEFVIQAGLSATGDASLLKQVLSNLMENAFKFTAKVPRAKIQVAMATHEGKEAFFVKDNGAGFDMAYAEKLFKPFQRLHPASEFPGTGVGLALVQRIINRHGGRVWAEAEPGAGATFYFTLQP